MSLFMSTDEKFTEAGSVELFKAMFLSTTKPWDTKKMPIYRRVEPIKDNGDFVFISS